MKILFYPKFDCAAAFTDHYFRAIWYLNPLAKWIDKVVFPYAEGVELKSCPKLLDDRLRETEPEAAFELQKLIGEERMRDLVAEADLVLVWRVNPKNPLAPVKALKGKKVVRIDHDNIQYAGSFYLMLNDHFPDFQTKSRESSQLLFDTIVQECSAKQGYVFGTGPNLSLAADYDYSDGVSIACNSMVRNEVLMDRLRPPIIVVGDPIFHAGPSSYAAAFRRDLIHAMDKFGSYLIVPERDHHIFMHHLPERLKKKICAIPYQQSDQPNLDLGRSFTVTSTANVLTLFLLPIAGTLFKRIGISGCDGRPLKENNYFWRHDPASQFQVELDEIKLVHPAFFNVDYDDYYSAHCDTVEKWIIALEKAGRAVECITPSYVPALAARLRTDLIRKTGNNFDEDLPQNKKALLIVDQDGQSNAGHFMGYNARLSEASRHQGIDPIVIGRKDLSFHNLPENLKILSCFSVHSWNVGTRTDGQRSKNSDTFAAELSDGLRTLRRHGYDQITVYIYCGSLEHAKIADELTEDFKKVRFVINAFWQYQITDPSIHYKNRWRPHISRIANNGRIRITAPTRKTAAQINSLFGLNLSVAPHPSTTFSDEAARAARDDEQKTPTGSIRVLFPGGMRTNKGFQLSVEAAKRLSQDDRFEVIVRASSDYAEEELKETVSALSGLSVSVESRRLDDEAFRRFLDASDIVVVPYLKSAFEARTSGLVVDAMILGKPVVALEETWLGDLVTSKKFGLAVSANPDSIIRGIEEISSNYTDYLVQVDKARSSYLQHNSWKSLVSDITRPAVVSPAPEKPARVPQFPKKRQQLVSQLPSNLRSPIFLPTDRVPQQAQLDGIQRVIDLYDGPLDQHRQRLRRFKQRRKSDRCFVIGNGPSLNETSLKLLRDEVTFATNGFFLKLPELNWAPTYYVVEDHLVAEDRADEINRLRGFNKLFPASLAYILNEDPDTTFFDHRPRKSFPDGFDFSFEADKNTYAGGTVTFTCMQLAAFMGFKEIYLIGVDASYAVPDDAKISGDHRVKEIDMESDDPNHFHPDYFGKGKRWHEPNVDVMLKAYEEAERETRTKGVSIINATKGGKLEVFPRTYYESLFKPKGSRPKVLLFDMTRVGEATATGQLKQSLLADWPQSKLCQVYHITPDRLGMSMSGSIQEWSVKRERDEIRSLLNQFDPDIVLFRPTPESPGLHAIAMEFIREGDKPLVTWIMDDWPTTQAKLKTKDAEAFLKDWAYLLERSTTRLSICDKMSEAFEARYKKPFRAIANGVNPSDWPKPQLRKDAAPVRVRYAGSLAENMSLHSILLVAEAVERLASDGVDIVFEIKTRANWHKYTKSHFKNFTQTSFMVADLTAEEYRQWLSGADISVIAYNFDTVSKQYTQYSLANKLPECLASGTALLGVGPGDVATIGVLQSSECARIVEQDSKEAVQKALSELATSATVRLELAKKAQSIAFSRFNIQNAQGALEQVLRNTEMKNSSTEAGLPRSKQAHVDETEVVSRMLADRKGRAHIMLDVGAHFGTSASYFHRMGWSIHCFEPDPKNRKRLTERYATSKNVTIDPRAVSDAPAEGVKFYTSEQSTGISGLHAFHDSHSETGLVDITTINDIVADRALSRADFLKIDVEGFDLSVLKGVPWGDLDPDVIECEFEDAKTIRLGHNWQDIANYLQDKGYSVYVSEWHPIIRYGIPHQWKRVFKYPSATMPPDAWGNLLAFKSDPGLSSVKAAFDATVKFRAAAPVKVESKEKMLKKTKATPIEAKISSESVAAPAQLESSRARRTGRFFSVAWQHFWARRKWSVPAVLVAGLVVGATYLSPISGFGDLARLGLILAGLAGFSLYVAFRAFSQITAVRLELIEMRNEVIRTKLAAQSQRAPLQTKLDEMSRQLEALETKNRADAKSRKNLFDRIDRLDVSVGRTIGQVQSALEDAKSEMEAALEERTATLGERLNSSLVSNSEKLNADLATFAGQMEHVKSETDKFAVSLQGTQEQTEHLNNKIRNVRKWAQYDHSQFYQYFNRILTPQHIDTLMEEWPKRIPAPISKQSVGYLAERVRKVEQDLDGRLATAIEDAVLRALVAKSIKGKNAHILEIGTLFGIGAGIIFDAIHSQFDSVHFTLLDPLEGYYHANQADVLTGLSVNEKVLRKNLKRVGMEDENFTLVKALSTDAEAIEAVAKDKFDLLIIDGDHSYAGVKTDFENYIQNVKLGGYVIFDDYGSKEWPEVQEYVDKELTDVDYIARVGASWRTCVYRVVKPPHSA